MPSARLSSWAICALFWLCATGTGHAQTSWTGAPTTAWTSSEAGPGFAFSVATRPSSGSGSDRTTILGSPKTDEPVTNPPWLGGGGTPVTSAGLVEIRSPALSDVARIYGTDLGHEFGHSVAWLSDLDGDGKRDFIVGAPGGNRAELFIGGESRLTQNHATIFGPSRFGHAVASLGDVDGDGREDFAVSSPGLTDGQVQVFTWDVVQGVIQKFAITAPPGARVFGGAIAAVPDLDGDGLPDIVVGASDDFQFQPCTVTGVRGPCTPGAIYTFRGINGAPLQSPLATGTEIAERFGYAVEGLPDLDGDGRGDIAVGSPYKSGGGAAQILSGATGAIIWSATGATSDASFGASLACLDDLDGDGRVELAVGAPRFSTSGFSGQTTVFDPMTGAVIFDQPTGGWAIGGGEDIDGDGEKELVISQGNKGPTTTVYGESRTWFVDPSYAGQFGISDGSASRPWAGLSEAINALTTSPGDTLMLAAGLYQEPHLLIEKNLTIIGQGPRETIIEPDPSNPNPFPDAFLSLKEVDENMSLSGLTLRKPDGGTIRWLVEIMGSPVLDNCWLLDGGGPSNAATVHVVADIGPGEIVRSVRQPSFDSVVIHTEEAAAALLVPSTRSSALDELGPRANITMDSTTVIGRLTLGNNYVTVTDSILDGTLISSCPSPGSSSSPHNRQCFIADHAIIWPTLPLFGSFQNTLVAEPRLTGPTRSPVGLMPDSPARGAGSGGSDLGAIPFSEAFPGTGDGLWLGVGTIQASPTSWSPGIAYAGSTFETAHELAASDLLICQVASDAGRYAGSPLFLAVDMVDVPAGQSPLAVSLGGIWVRPWNYQLLVGESASLAGPTVLASPDSTVVFQAPPSLPPVMLRLQAAVASTLAANGQFALSPAHEVLVGGLSR